MTLNTSRVNWSIPLMALIFSLFLSSCVTNKKAVYFQDKTVKKPHKVDVDRSQEEMGLSLKLDVGDAILVKIEYTPLTEPEITGADRLNTLEAKSHPFENGYVLDSLGQITLPNLGTFSLLQKTLQEAQNLISQKAASVYQRPVVSVFLLNFEVNVLGEVNQPGKYSFSGTKVSVLDALATAGDINTFGNKKSVKVIRNRHGKMTVYHLDLTDLEALFSQKIYLRPNDTVVIKPLPAKKFAGDNSRWIVLSFSAIISFVAVFFR